MKTPANSRKSSLIQANPSKLFGGMRELDKNALKLKDCLPIPGNYEKLAYGSKQGMAVRANLIVMVPCFVVRATPDDQLLFPRPLDFSWRTICKKFEAGRQISNHFVS
jgi:hypothetical protein